MYHPRTDREHAFFDAGAVTHAAAVVGCTWDTYELCILQPCHAKNAYNGYKKAQNALCDWSASGVGVAPAKVRGVALARLFAPPELHPPVEWCVVVGGLGGGGEGGGEGGGDSGEPGVIAISSLP